MTMFSSKTRTRHSLVQLILVCLCGASLANDTRLNILAKKQQMLDQILESGKYDARIRPSGLNETDGPAILDVIVYVRSISKVDDVNMEYSLQLTYRQAWTDERLKFDDIGGELKYLTLPEANRIWMADLFFTNEKESHFHKTFAPNSYVRIFPAGRILYSTRLSLTLNCPMNFQLFPFDRQNCPMRLSTYGTFANDVVLLWKEWDAVQTARDVKVQTFQKFSLKNVSSDYCPSNANAEFSCLNVNFLFERNLLHYATQLYIPSCILVFASWISFWLNEEAVTARVLLGAATLLTMVMQVSNIYASVPATSYVKAIDIWTWVCLAFVFGALMESALVNCVFSSDMKKNGEQSDVNTVPNLIYSDSNKKMKTWPVYWKYWLSKISRSRKIDIISRIMFPLIFAAFNSAYWSIYLRLSDDDYP